MSENARLIDPVKDKYDKSETYRKQLGRYKKAMNNEFYFEALLIVYGMLEDRLRSFLYYIGAMRREDSGKLDESKTRGILRCMYFGSTENAKNKNLDINNISCKEKLIRKTLEWAIIQEGKPEEQYLALLKREYEGCLDIGGLLEILEGIEKWRGYRNEVIHGLLNKNVDSLNEELCKQVEMGMQYARFIDSQVKALKKKDTIRIEMKIKR